MSEFSPLLTRRYGVENSHRIDVAEAHGVYSQAKRALTSMEPAAICEEVKKASIRGRGGAGFPAGVKWGFLDPKPDERVYLVVNGDESEPGTFKDTSIMTKDPHRFIEGMIITCFAIRANTAYLYIRGELASCIDRMEVCIAEAKTKGYLGERPFGVDFPIEIHVHSGAGAYICGEETALLSSLEGKRGEPRLKPPFPAIKGAFDQPTIVNNVETVAQVADIIELGGEAWCNRSRLAPNDGGTRLYGVSGHVKRPGIYEGPVGLTMRELIYDMGQGMLDDSRPLKAVIPGGSSTPVLRPDALVQAEAEDNPLHAWHGKSEIDVPMGVDTYRALGTMLGTCCAIVMDTSVSMVEVARNLMKFYAHESCGQCTPCREGSGWLVDLLNHVSRGEGRAGDVPLVVDVANNMMGNTICAFAEGTAMPMLGLIRQFRDEFEAAAREGVKDRRMDRVIRPQLFEARVP